MKPNDIDRLVNALVSTPDSLENVLEKLFNLSYSDLSSEDLQALDSKVLLCSECGWWYFAEEIFLDRNKTVYVCIECEE